MSNLKVLVGPHLSGKTTWCLEYMKRNPSYVRVSREQMLQMLYGGPLTHLPGMEELDAIKIGFISTITALLSNGKSVIVDDCNLKNEDINLLSDCFADSVNFFTFQVFDETINTLKMRNQKRKTHNGKFYPDSTILKQSSQLIKMKNILPTEKLTFNAVIT
jgi:predicted kinase